MTAPYRACIRSRFSVMASPAIIGYFSFLMTVDAKTHRVVHNTFRNAHLRHVAVAHGALHLGADMWRMVESDMRFIVPPIDSLPRYVFAAIMVRRNLLDLLVVAQRVDMAAPARSDVGYTGLRTPCNRNMTVGAIQLNVFNVPFVIEGNRLVRMGTYPKEMLYCLAYRGMSRRERF